MVRAAWLRSWLRISLCKLPDVPRNRCWREMLQSFDSAPERDNVEYEISIPGFHTVFFLAYSFLNILRVFQIGNLVTSSATKSEKERQQPDTRFGFSKVATAIPTTGLPSYCANFQLPPPVRLA